MVSKTSVAWLLAIAGLAVYEIYTVFNGIPGDTLSEAVWAACSNRPFIPFLAGFICGHFFWQKDPV